MSEEAHLLHWMYLVSTFRSLTCELMGGGGVGTSHSSNPEPGRLWVEPVPVRGSMVFYKAWLLLDTGDVVFLDWTT